MNSNTIFSKSELQRLNYDIKYGYNLINNLENIKDDEQIKLYLTGYYSLRTGRQYVALPANKKITQNDILLYNIIS